MKPVVPFASSSPRVWLSRGEVWGGCAGRQLPRCYRVGVLNPPENPWWSSLRKRVRGVWRRVEAFVAVRIV
jgi:hypothetical protein